MGRRTPTHVEIEVENGDFEKAFKEFKSKVKKSGILNLVRKKAHYEKPSSIRRGKRLKKKKLIAKENNK